MALPTIFCPQCDTLILEAKQCPTCQWQRPTGSGEVGKPAWAVALGAKLPSKASHPLVGESTVYIPTDSGEIVALDTLESEPDNIIKWRHQIDSRYRSHGLAVWKDTIILGNEFTGGFPTPPGELILLDAKSGVETWRYKVEGASLSVPVVHKGTAYFTVNSGWLYAIDLEARKELWRQPVESPWSWAPAAPMLTSSGLLILASRSDKLVAFNTKKGEIAWTFSGGGWFAQTPIWVEGMVYARCWDKHIYALDGTDGQEIWQCQFARDHSSDLWVNQTYLYIGIKDYQAGAEQGSPAYALYVFDRQTGKRIGRYEVPGHIFARPIATENAVFFATDDKSKVIESQGTLYALDAQGQKLLWEPCVVEQRFQSDLLLVGDKIIAGTRQGAVYAVSYMAEEAITGTPQNYAAQGGWEKAAIAHAFQQEYLQAAEIYATKLEQPLTAGRIYLHVGEYHQVIELLGQSEIEAERELAIAAAQAIPELDQRALALSETGEFLSAAETYTKAGMLEEAGDCYLEAQDLEQAQAAYEKAGAREKWKKVAREREEWQALIEWFVKEEEYPQAAKVQLELGNFLEAATFYDQAGMAAEALEAYRQVDSEDITDEARQRMLELAEQVGEVDIVLEAHQASGQFAEAAELAEANSLYTQALEFYRKAGNNLKAAEMLEKLVRYAEAADMYEQARRFGRAAKNLEQQVEQEIERVGGIRYVTDTEQLEMWLNRAVELYEEEADYAQNETDRKIYYEGADRCRVSLMRIRREPLLQLSLQADRLVYNQGNAIHYVVENVGWGSARNLTFLIGSSNLLDEEQYDLGSLGRRQKAEGTAMVVPTLVGEIMLQIELRGHSRSGELHQSETHTVDVAPMQTTGGQGVSLNTQVGRGAERLRTSDFPVVDRRGTLWEVGGTGSSVGAQGEGPVSPEQLKAATQSRLKQKHAPQPIAIGAAVISGVIITFELEVEAQDIVNDEIKWLFSAADHYLKIRRGEVERTQPIAVDIPDDAVRDETANNQLLSTIDDFDILALEGHIVEVLDQINGHLGNLKILRTQEMRKGAAGKGDVALQNNINTERRDIVENLIYMAQLINQAYGILVTSPDELGDLFY